MSGRLLDTVTLIDLARSVRSVTDRYLAALQGEVALYLSTVSVFEFRYGIERSTRHAAQQSAFERLSATIEITPLDLPDAALAAQVKARLASSGGMIGAYDLLIAGQALARGWTLVTSNVREFSRVGGLAIPDWGAELNPSSSPCRPGRSC